MSILFGNKSSSVIDASKYTVEDNGLLTAHMELLEATVEITESFHALDMAEIQYNRDVENGAVRESAYMEYEAVTENMFTNAWEKIKKAIKMLWEKVKTFFKNFGLWVKSLTGDNQAFLKLYRERANRFSGTFEMSYFDKFEISKVSANTISAIGKMNIKASELTSEDVKDGALVKKFNEAAGLKNGDQFSDSLYKALRGGKSEPSTKNVTSANISGAIKVIEEFVSESGKIKELGDKMLEVISSFQTQLDGLENSATDKDNDVQKKTLENARAGLTGLNAVNAQVSKIVTASIAALKQQTNTAKSMVSGAARRVKSK